MRQKNAQSNMIHGGRRAANNSRRERARCMCACVYVRATPCTMRSCAACVVVSGLAVSWAHRAHTQSFAHFAFSSFRLFGRTNTRRANSAHNHHDSCWPQSTVCVALWRLCELSYTLTASIRIRLGRTFGFGANLALTSAVMGT